MIILTGIKYPMPPPCLKCGGALKAEASGMYRIELKCLKCHTVAIEIELEDD